MDQPIPPIYCADTQERIPPEYFGQRKAVWCNGKPYMVGAARRLRLMPDPSPPYGYEALQFGRELPPDSPALEAPHPSDSPAGPQADPPRRLPPAAAFKPAEILAAVKSGTLPAAAPAEIDFPKTGCAPGMASAAYDETVMTQVPRSDLPETEAPAQPPEEMAGQPTPPGQDPQAISKPSSMGTQHFRRLAAAAQALEEAARQKKALKKKIEGPTPPPVNAGQGPVPTVSAAAISTLRAEIVPARIPDAPDPASHVVAVKKPRPAADAPPSYAQPPVDSACDGDAAPEPEGVTRIVLLKNIRARRQQPQEPQEPHEPDRRNAAPNE